MSRPHKQPHWTLQEIAAITRGQIHGDSATPITGVASIAEAAPGDLVFAESARYLTEALRSPAAAILTAPEVPVAVEEIHKPLILVDNPRLAFLQVLEALAPPPRYPASIHPTAVLGDHCQIGAGSHIGPHVTIGARATLGDRVVVLSGAHIGDECVIGDDTIIHPNVVLYPGVTVGKRCLLHAGCVIGADGFGFIPVGETLRKVPQQGTVIIDDDVEIGASTCIDRAKTGATRIGPGTKIDNLVHVGHNVHIGASCIIIAQVGIAGSVEIGNGVILAGQAGIKDHVKIGDGARIAAQGGVFGDVPPGATYSGYPARPHAQKLREHAATAQLPEYLRRIRALEQKVEELLRRQS
ncbi:MAG: UDP-3-O-(3-hydroxymyristoyl)glucosamine N-acyltransferase [Chloroherpetonaceae bacterium]|nr:UDP-3-O-(3-hydroxymyristoyl)glucosamine N-acyltransferase [Chthonomonadaceae bacterium]MDW8208011.1 UDP-3-O-(3-hydroxymyristoyl)glucosamine N-acyltransferase [Chloroherpetonaceae bacterium]